MSKIGSMGAAINSQILADKFRTAKMIMHKSQSPSPIHGHLKILMDRGLIIQKTNAEGAKIYKRVEVEEVKPAKKVKK